MRVVVQRVAEARVSVRGKGCGEIGPGLVILLGVARGDTEDSARWLAAKCADLRIFEDEEGKMNVSARDAGASFLVVSQFTLLGDATKGRRPGFDRAAPPDEGRRLYGVFVEELRASGLPVEEGVFQEKMRVEIHNDGPVTLVIDKE